MFSTIVRRFLEPLTEPIPKFFKEKKQTICPRDPVLEAHAKSLLEPYAPELAARVAVRWNKRLRTTAGLASYERCEVMLHVDLKKISEAEVEKTLRHELAHLLARARSGRRRIAPHGIEWRQACSDLGIPGEGRTHTLPFARRRQARKFFYSCPSCNDILSRVHKPRRPIACLSCCRKHARGRYDERFRYKKLSITPEHF